jgi:diguanylate cyclase (GGDEF)-like protein
VADTIDDRLPDDDDEAIAALTALQGRKPAEALPVLRSLLAAVSAAGRRRVQGYLLCHLARCQSMVGQGVAAEATANEALALFEALGSAAGRSVALNAQAMLLAARGDCAAALERLSVALPLARQAGDTMLIVGLLNSFGSTLYDIGDASAATAAYEECLALLPAEAGELRSVSVRSNLALALARWAEQDRDSGLPAATWMPRARRAVDLARGLQAQQADPQTQAHVAGLESLSLALLVSGDAAQALSVLDSEPARHAAQSSPYFAVHFAQTQSRALLALGRPLEAVQACERALAQAHQADSEAYCDVLYQTLSMAHEAAGDLKAALQTHRQFHAIRARLVFERAAHVARGMVSQLELDRALRESRVDALTGLVNRRGFDERMQALLPTVSRTRPLTLMLMDVDQFKAVNDSLGHPAGDALLRRLAALLRTLCRGSEPPARLGGDEFAVLIEGTLDQGLVLAGRIRAGMATDAGADDAATSATVSIGLAEARTPCGNDELLARADRALYAVKRQGGDGILTTP